jgi:CPA1 family monovalent cation:H+ antiporter
VSLFALMSLLILLTALFSYINHRYIGFPTTIGVMFIAMIVSLGTLFAGGMASSLRDHAAQWMQQIDFNQTVLHGMLAFLLFAGAIHLDLSDLGREWLTISLLSIVGTAVSTAIVGGMIWWTFHLLHVELPLIWAMLFGALISPTDPIAVLGIMKQANAPATLQIQMSGESLFNDGIGVVIFLILLELLQGHEPITAFMIGNLVVREVFGAIVMGLVCGFVSYQMLRSVDNYQVEVLLTLATAMGCYALADALHLSAPIAVVVAGLFIGNHGRRFAMSQKTREHVDTFWELIDEILNAVLFVLIGLEMLVIPLQWNWSVAAGVAIAAVLLARWLSVAGIISSVGAFRTYPRGTIPVLTWGGLRGGISVAMALSLPSGEQRNLLIAVTYAVVVFSILVQGLTIGRLILRVTSKESAESATPFKLAHHEPKSHIG